MRTIWLLDVDGVLNADRPGWSAAPERATVYADTAYPLRWAPALLRRVRRVIALIDVVWCTTWCPHAGEVERAMRLPALERALTDEQCQLSPGQIDLAKLAAAREVVERGDRLIWTDDTAIPQFGPPREQLERNGRALLIAPRSKVGLQPSDMDAVEAFAQLAPRS